MICTTSYNSPVGKILLATKEDALIGLWIEGQKHCLHSLRNEGLFEKETPTAQKAKKWLDRYFGGEKPEIGELQLAPIGSAFAQSVWQILCQIPYGSTITYGAIASQIAKRQGQSTFSAQAVGGAVGHNPISIIIPCHRVIGAGGNLTGYAGGIDKKIKLLTHEGVDISGFFIPKNSTAP